MKVTKIGHCCLLIELKGKRILTDPGMYTAEVHSRLEGLDFILFTHEHQDHYHLESLKTLLEKNPSAIVYANDSVSKLLEQENIQHNFIKNGDQVMLGDIALNGIGEKHAELHSSVPLSSNIGFLIDARLWYPGDAFTDPKTPVEILALPVAGPWLKVSESIDYALSLKPQKAFPVHDAVRHGVIHGFVGKILSQNSIEFVPMIENDSQEF